MSGGPVLVTGAAGFAGSHLVEHLAPQAQLVAWSRSDPPASLAPLARWQRVDLLDRKAVREALSDVVPAVVFHCAGVPQVAQSFRRSTHVLRGNVLATHILLDELRRLAHGAHVLVTGSATVYAASDTPLDEGARLEPTSPYALSKLAQEARALRALREDGLEVVVARSFNHTGPRQTPDFAAPSFARQIALIERGTLAPVIRVGNLEALRDFSDVRDVVRAYRLLAEHGTTGRIYNVASGVGRSIRSVLDGLVARCRVAVEVELDPTRLRPSDTPAMVGDATRLVHDTGWKPLYPFERTLDDLLDYWRGEVVVDQGPSQTSQITTGH